MERIQSQEVNLPKITETERYEVRISIYSSVYLSQANLMTYTIFKALFYTVCKNNNEPNQLFVTMEFLFQ
jgi:hypothetical protein